ncbi:MAG: glycoside hydrolase family 3 N-terminal domain-containing protein [Cyclonatronaceae bacterium]
MIIKIVNILKLLPFLLLLLACQSGKGGMGGIEARNNHLNSDLEMLPALIMVTDPVSETIERLIREMTLEEKVGQMTQITLDVLGEGENVRSSFEPFRIDPEMMSKAFIEYHVGSVLNTANNRARTPEVWNNIIKEIQDYAIEHSRFDIPVIYGLDMIHGASYVAGATLFPQQVGMAATWNPELVKRAGEITAYETRAIGVAWTFSPVLDLGVDPRWPRHWETFGEDPYLASVLGHAIVTGYQGPGIGSPYHIAACLKHYLGYSHTLSGRDRSPAWIPESQLREYHVPSFQAGLEAGSMTVMLNSGEINGIPVHANKELITGLLKTEHALQGFVLTDWLDIIYLYTRHRVASSYKDAVRIAINAGVDMSMVPYDFDFSRYLVELVNEGEVSMERIDDAVRRILRVKMEMGLFETPYTFKEDYPEFASRDFADAAYQTAVESITLLKNEGSLLPLGKETRILVAGPAANTMRPLNGGWSYSWQGNLVDEFASDYNTIYEALKAKAGDGRISVYETVRYNHDGAFDDEFVDDYDQFREYAIQADVILLALGENSYTEGEGDMDDLYLSANQQRLVMEAASTGKPVILVMAQGRPRIISKVEPAADVILNTYLPGNYGGDALASIIYGDANPSGKLPYTYPRYPNQLIPYYHKHTENVEKTGTPTGTAFYPQYEFGFGLSYSVFEYISISADNSNYVLNDTVLVTVELRNISKRAGEEVVQLYSSQQYASITPPVKRLRAFEKTMVPAGESVIVTFAMPVSDLAFVNADNRKVVESGPYTLKISDLETKITVSEAGVVN